VNGCGGESIVVRVQANADDGGYEHLVTEAMRRVHDHLGGVRILRHRHECVDADRDDQWYIGCAHSEISLGGQQIDGVFTFIRYGSEP
jgi:hypothetical protein